MDIRSARLMIPHPAAQHSQPHMSILSPNAKSLYKLEYLHQVPTQYRSQQNDFYNSNNSNGGRLSYSNERNNGSRYNHTNSNSGNNKYTNKSTAQANSTSVSPPLSITSSGSSTTSSKNSRASKSYNGNSMHGLNNHRNIPTTPTIQQSHNGYFQSQSIPFFHSATSNGIQQMFSTAISPGSQSQHSQHSQHSNQSVGMYVQQNSSSGYHSNNNYHTHNRNYGGKGNKRNWSFYR